MQFFKVTHFKVTYIKLNSETFHMDILHWIKSELSLYYMISCYIAVFLDNLT